jgi:23S rRNA-/tRNA-specific pseudouridylate synthase
VENVSTEARRDLRVGEQLHEAEKRYLAVVEGSPPADHGVLRSHLDESGPFKVYSALPSERTTPCGDPFTG